MKDQPEWWGGGIKNTLKVDQQNCHPVTISSLGRNDVYLWWSIYKCFTKIQETPDWCTEPKALESVYRGTAEKFPCLFFSYPSLTSDAPEDNILGPDGWKTSEMKTCSCKESQTLTIKTIIVLKYLIEGIL